MARVNNSGVFFSKQVKIVHQIWLIMSGDHAWACLSLGLCWLHAPYLTILYKFVPAKCPLVLQLTPFHPFIIGVMAELWAQVTLLKFLRYQCISLLHVMHLQEVLHLIYRLFIRIRRMLREVRPVQTMGPVQQITCLDGWSLSGCGVDVPGSPKTYCVGFFVSKNFIAFRHGYK